MAPRRPRNSAQRAFIAGGIPHDRREPNRRAISLGGQRIDLLERAHLVKAVDDAIEGRRRPLRLARAVSVLGAEWAYRLVKETRRLARCYLAQGPSRSPRW